MTLSISVNLKWERQIDSQIKHNNSASSTFYGMHRESISFLYILSVLVMPCFVYTYSLLATYKLKLGWLEPESTGFLEQGHKGTVDMGSHDSVHTTHKLATNEDDWDGGGTALEAHEGFLHVPPSGVLQVQLVHSRVDAHAAEELLDGVAHAAVVCAEDDHRILGGQPLYALQRITCSCHRVSGRPINV